MLLDITLMEQHAVELRRLLARPDGIEAAAYILFGEARIGTDPWHGRPRRRLVSHRVVPIAETDMVSASARHVTWATPGFMRLLAEARADGLVPGLVHTHPSGFDAFSDQDDRNEAELARTAANKGMPGLASLILVGADRFIGRLWSGPGSVMEAEVVRSVGPRIHVWPRHPVLRDAAFLARQATLFGPAFNPLLASLRIAVVGCGGTGSAVAMLLMRLGVGHIVLIDGDVVDATNLNRLHGATIADVGSPKVDVLAREIRHAKLGTKVATSQCWLGASATQDALRAADLVFGCTDDHHGRLLLNRLAYAYASPLIDLGLRIRPKAEAAPPEMTGRVSTVLPGRPCLLCLGAVDPRIAAEDALRRKDPAEFGRRKAEAYVVGGGDPAPAVVTFTTELAAVAVNDMIDGLTGFRGAGGMAHNRIRRFDTAQDRLTSCTALPHCPVCQASALAGRGDIEPFLGVLP
jgi:molybdopterin/thiamine biosynthesis adenylyltransferase